jgi:hypothetical protein
MSLANGTFAQTKAKPTDRLAIEYMNHHPDQIKE